MPDKADAILLIAGIACATVAIIGGGLRFKEGEVPKVDSLLRQIILGFFGAGLILSGLIVGGHVRLPEPSDFASKGESSIQDKREAPAQTHPKEVKTEPATTTTTLTSTNTKKPIGEAPVQPARTKPGKSKVVIDDDRPLIDCEAWAAARAKMSEEEKSLDDAWVLDDPPYAQCK